MTEIPHLAYPIRFTTDPLGATRYAAVDQGTPDHLAQRVEIAARTIIGDRLEDPTFGVPDHVMRTPHVDLDRYRQALADSEPDADLIVDRITEPDDTRVDRLHALIHEQET